MVLSIRGKHPPAEESAIVYTAKCTSDNSGSGPSAAVSIFRPTELGYLQSQGESINWQPKLMSAIILEFKFSKLAHTFAIRTGNSPPSTPLWHTTDIRPPRRTAPMLHLAGASMSRGKAIRAIHITNQAVKQSQSQSPSPFTRTQLRSFQLSPGVYAMAHAAKVQFATGADETTLTAALQGLLDSAEKGGRWSLIPSGRGLERSFKFKNFAKTWRGTPPRERKRIFITPQTVTSRLGLITTVLNYEGL
ncbi:hypothetical protein CIB48_g11526 [Xylaria polymorpha]|nr:hypothetical protein CIB48_g11526 [Xylaria polymorpha]